MPGLQHRRDRPAKISLTAAYLYIPKPRRTRSCPHLDSAMATTAAAAPAVNGTAAHPAFDSIPDVIAAFGAPSSSHHPPPCASPPRPALPVRSS